MAEAKLFYVYGIMRGADSGSPPSDGLRLVHTPLVSAVVELVPEARFSPEAVEKGARELDWVAPLARRHQRVLEELMRKGPVIPARLCTLFSSEQALDAYLEENGRRLLELLERLRERQEWSIKLTCDWPTLRAAIAAADASLRLEPATATTGQAYLARKRRDRQLEAFVLARVEEVADELVVTVKRLTDLVHERPLFTEGTAGRPEPMLVNLAVFVTDRGLARLTGTLDQLQCRLGPEGFAIAVSGPWPPYSFCDDAFRAKPASAAQAEGES